jgi:hypothetical protein
MFETIKKLFKKEEKVDPIKNASSQIYMPDAVMNDTSEIFYLKNEMTHELTGFCVKMNIGAKTFGTIINLKELINLTDTIDAIPKIELHTALIKIARERFKNNEE